MTTVTIHEAKTHLSKLIASGAKVLLVPSSPAAVHDLGEQIRQAVVVANEITGKT